MSDLESRVSFAWKVHDALDSWVGKVDQKASIVLAIESAVLGLVVTLSAKDGPLAQLHDWGHARFLVACSLLGLGALLSGLAVFPQLGRRQAKQDWRNGIIYFGHLRRWDPVALESHLLNDPEVSSLGQLARQHVTVAKIAWRKHVLLQWSMGISTIAVIMLLWVAFRR